MLLSSRLNLAENIMSFDQRFWLRLATRSDAAQDDEEKQQLAALAKVGGAWQQQQVVWRMQATGPGNRAACLPAGSPTFVSCLGTAAAASVLPCPAA